MWKSILTEQEFDSLAEGSQIYYRYCPYCGSYYHRSVECLCRKKFDSLCRKEGKQDAEQKRSSTGQGYKNNS